MSLTTSAHWMYNPGGGFYGYEIEQSLRTASGYLTRTFASAGNAQRMTISLWVKRANLDTGKQHFLLRSVISTYDAFWIQTDYKLRLVLDSANAYAISWDGLMRDTSAWYHIVLAIDTTQSDPANRFRCFRNGEELSYSGSVPPQNYNLFNFNKAVLHSISYEPNGGFIDGYIADYNFIDGTAYTADSFGELKSGIWIPKDTSGLTFGTNGFHLEFAGNASDTSGNGNNWTANNISSYDYVPDSPTNNFPTFPKLALKGAGYTQHLESNLQLYQPSWGGWDIRIASSNMPASGKYYWEVYPAQGNFNAGYGGFTLQFDNIRGNENMSGFPQFGAPLAYWYGGGLGEYRVNPGWVNYTKSGSFAYTVNSTVFQVAVDCDNNKIWYGINNSWMGVSGTTVTAGTGNPATGANGQAIAGDVTDYVFAAQCADQQSACRLGINFGQDSTFAGYKTAGGNSDANGYGDFQYAPPSGFVALCSQNMPEPAIDTLNDETPEDYFNTVLWTGDNTNNRAITGVGFQPDLVAAKSRSANSGFNWVDAVRGGTKNLKSNDTSAEQTVNTVISFQSDGFTVGDGNGYDINKSGEPIVGWSWFAGNSTSSNTDGSITSTVSVGATSQQNWFSIVSYTGTGANATVGHGLGVAPKLIFVRNRNGGDFKTYSEDVGNTYQGFLNDPSAFVNSGASIWQNTSPTSSVFSIGTNAGVNQNGVNLIAYCFANAEGLCKIGKFSGNGSTTDGVFVYLGFRPAFLLYKQTTASANWEIIDNTRNPYNVSNARLFPSSSQAEFTNETVVDLLSNGFKARDAYGGWNFSGQDYLYLAIAEQPFKYANAR